MTQACERLQSVHRGYDWRLQSVHRGYDWRLQSVHRGHDWRRRGLGAGRQGDPGWPGVHLHPGDHQLPGAACRHSLPHGHFLPFRQRAGACPSPAVHVPSRIHNITTCTSTCTHSHLRPEFDQANLVRAIACLDSGRILGSDGGSRGGPDPPRDGARL